MSKSTHDTYFPSHRTSLMLAAHVEYETGKIAGAYVQHPAQNSGKVLFSRETNEHIYGASKDTQYVDMTADLQNWRIFKVSDDRDTGYCGIIYINRTTQQMVVAHRSTDFALGLTTINIVKGSGVQQDVSILTNHVSLHQSKAYQFTKMAVELVQTRPEFRDYSLSFTGHSLGAWLAEMSVYYCLQGDLKHPFVQAVTVDGPGSRGMMEHMQSKSMRPNIDPESLPVVSYLDSPPNIVNTAGKHVGQVFALKAIPEEERSTAESVALRALEVSSGSAIAKAITATAGHDLKYILPRFDATTGLPRECVKVDSWPSTDYTGTHPDNSWCGRFANCFKRILCCSADDADNDGARKDTLSSTFGFFLALSMGQIDQSDLESVFTTRRGEDGAFEIKYDGNLRVAVFNPKHKTVTDFVDKVLVLFKQKAAVVRSQLKEGTVITGFDTLMSKYNVNFIEDTITSLGENTIFGVRDSVRELLHRGGLTAVLGIPSFPPKPLPDLTGFVMRPDFKMPEENMVLLGEGSNEPFAGNGAPAAVAA
jgi:hypothetical protein